jgi:hypothetical protein
MNEPRMQIYKPLIKWSEICKEIRNMHFRDACFEILAVLGNYLDPREIK